MKRILAGLASLAVVLGLVVGIPAALILLTGNPIPSIEELTHWLTRPDWGGKFLTGSLIPCAAWVAWGVFVVPFLTSFPEVIRSARMSRTTTPHTAETRVGASGPFKLQRKAAGVLLGAIIVMFGGGQAALAAPLEASPSVGIVQTVDQGSSAPQAGEAPDMGETAAAPESAPAAAPAVADSVVVESGDSLWAIAEQELGDGNRYNELFDASHDIVQPDGTTIEDPNLIHPGWSINLPGADAQAAPPVEAEPAPAPAAEQAVDVDQTVDAGSSDLDDTAASSAAPENETAAPGTADEAETSAAETAAPAPEAPAPSPEVPEEPAAATPAPERTAPATGGGAAPERSAEVHSEAQNVVDDTEDSAPAALAAGGIAGVLGAALLGGLGIRRKIQRRNRRRNETIAMPDPEAAVVEAQLREVQEPLALHDVDAVCRFLTSWARESNERLPELLAVRLAPDERQISIFLMGAAELPAPFVAVAADHTAWQIHDADMAALGNIYEAGAYPALVTLGKDQAGGHILIDLEQWGDIAITGTRELAVAAATATVLELAHVSWADETLIHVVGDTIEIPETLGNGRCEHHADMPTLLRRLQNRAAGVRASLAASEQTSSGRARTADTGESWTPEIVVVSEATEDELAELKQLVTERPRLGIISLAVGGSGSAEIVMKAEEEAVFAPAGLTYVPQLVNAAALAQLEAVFAATDEPAVPAQHVDESPLEESLAEAIPVDEPEEVTEPEQEEAAVDHADETVAEPAAAETAFAPEVAPEEAADLAVDVQISDELEAEEEHAHVLEREFRPVVQLEPRDPSAPYVRVLGRVEIESGAARELGKPELSRAIELLAFLTLHPNATTEEYARAFWPNKTPQQASSSMRKLTNVTRNWLGDAPDGEHYLPRHDVSNGYRAHHDVRSDWGDFQTLVGEDPMLTATENLVEALQLVRDQPFTGVKDRYYTWAELDKELMISAIADAADELYARAHETKDTVRARYAATLGKRVAPESEIAWRNSLRSALSQGDAAEFERLVNDLIENLDTLGEEFDPEIETRALIEEGRSALAGV